MKRMILTVVAAMIAFGVASLANAAEPKGKKESQPKAAVAAVPDAKKAPYGWLDQPVAGPVKGKTRVYGWALSDQGKVSKIEILLDGKPLKGKIERVRRGGICEKYPGRADCPNVGFTGEVDFSSVKKGPHVLSARFTDNHRNSAELGKRNITVE